MDVTAFRRSGSCAFRVEPRLRPMDEARLAPVGRRSLTRMSQAEQEPALTASVAPARRKTKGKPSGRPTAALGLSPLARAQR